MKTKILSILAGLLLFCSPAFAASRYWVGGGSSTNWAATGNTNWSATSGGANNASVPGSSDDVFFDANSGSGTANISASITVLSVDCTGFTGTWTQADSTNLSVAGGNLKLVAGMTYAPTSDTQAIIKTGTGNITTGGKLLGNFTVNGAGITATLLDSFTQRAATTTLTLTNGTLDTNGQSVSIGIFSSSNSNTRVLTLGSSAVSVNGASGTVWTIASGTFTLNPNTSVVTCTGASPSFNAGAKTFNSLVFNGTGTVTLTGATTSATFTITSQSLTLSSTWAVTGTLNYNGTSPAAPSLLSSSTLGTARTVTLTGATLNVSNLGFRDITAATATDLSAKTGVGDRGGNTSITFPTPATLYWFKDTGSWSDSSKWFLGSGGTGGAGRVPLPQDTIVFDASSFSQAGQTVTVDGSMAGTSLSFAAVTNNPTVTLANGFISEGDVTLASGMTWGGAFGMTFEKRGTSNLTSAGKSFGAGLTSNGFGGNVKLLDDAVFSGTCAINQGLDMNGKNLTCNVLSSTSGNTRTLTFSTGTLTLAGTGTVLNITASGLTLSAASSTIAVTDVSSSTKTIAGGGQTYGNITLTGGGSGAVIFTGANTFATFTIGGSKTVTLPAATTTTVTSLVGNGTAGAPITLNSSTGASAATISDSSGLNLCKYCTIQDSTVSGGAVFVAPHGTSTSNNTGWRFISQDALTLALT